MRKCEQRESRGDERLTTRRPASVSVGHDGIHVGKLLEREVFGPRKPSLRSRRRVIFARDVLTVGDGRPRIVQAGFDATIVPNVRYGTGLLLMPDVTLAFGV